MRVPSLLFAAVALSACAAGPDYQAPEVSLAPYRAEFPQDGAKAPLDKWWEGFSDPALTRIVERALAQNLDLAASEARIGQARAVAEAAGAHLLPAGQFDSQIANQRQSLQSPLGKIASHFPGYDRNQSLYDAGAGASWEIDIAGGLRRGLEAADAEAEAAEAAHLGTKIMVAAEAADAYLQIRGDQARLDLAEQQIAADAHLVELVSLRLNKGAATERELAQSQAVLHQAQALLPPLRIALSAQLNRLDVLMGAQPGTYQAELKIPAAIPALPAISAEQPADLLRRRPDVIVAERKLAASNAAIGVAVSDYYPKLSLSGLLGFESLSSGRLISESAFQPQAVAGLRWRLFDFGKVDAEVNQAKAINQESLAAYRATMLRATEEVEDALTSVAELNRESAALSNESEALTRARDRAQEAYLGGAVSLIEVLDADRQLLTAKDDLAHTETDRARSAVSAFRALGGGW
jgi:NodT family efflux transporter outer membrane factor (OMF) lipoprotein